MWKCFKIRENMSLHLLKYNLIETKQKVKHIRVEFLTSVDILGSFLIYNIIVVGKCVPVIDSLPIFIQGKQLLWLPFCFSISSSLQKRGLP